MELSEMGYNTINGLIYWQKNSRYCDVILIFTALVLVTPVSYSYTSLNPLIPVLEEVFNSTYFERYDEPIPVDFLRILLSFVFSFPILVSLIGASTTKYIVDFFGPKKTQLGLHSLNVLANVITIALIGGLTRSYEAFVIGRMMLGFGLGLGLNVGSLLIGETCARSRQPFFQSILGVGMALGALLGPIFGYNKVLGTVTLWPLLISTASIPSVLWLCASPFITESPVFLLKKGKREEAKRVMRKLRYGCTDIIEEEISLIESEQSAGDDPSAKDKTISLTGMFRTKQYRRIFLAVIITYANQMLVGFNHIVFFSDQLFLYAGIAKESVTLATIGVFSAQFIVAFFGSKIIEKFGAKKVNIGGAIVMIFGHILITVSLATLDDVPNMRYLSIVGMVIFMLGWSGGPNIATYPIVYAVSTPSTRTTCINYGSTALWIAGFFVGFLPPYLQPILGAYIMIPWMVFTIISMLYTIFFIPDIHMKTNEEIQEFMKRK